MKIETYFRLNGSSPDSLPDPRPSGSVAPEIGEGNESAGSPLETEEPLPDPSPGKEGNGENERSSDVIVEFMPEPDLPSRAVRKRGREDDTPVQGPIGLDIGTTHLVLAEKKGPMFKSSLLPNAFFSVPASSLTKQALERDDVLYLEKDSTLHILGPSAEEFANIFHSTVRKPIENGILNPRENESEVILKALISRLVRAPKKRRERVCFSMPGDPADKPGTSLVYHESIIKEHLSGLGYDPVPINEGLAVVLSELSGENYTGIGISLGGGMCNVCFSYLTVPVVTFSLLKGGDHIDRMVSQSIGDSISKVRQVKEHSLDLNVTPRDKTEMGLHIYYDDLITTLLQTLQNVLAASDNIPRLTRPVPIVLGGGTSLPRGVRDRVWKQLKTAILPFRISELVLAGKPLYATAKGALMMALLGD